MNWSIIDTGSFDYAADSWGYTYGAAVEWYQGWWTIRAGLFNLSKIPNGKALDTQVLDQYQLDEELEVRHKLFGQPGKLKLLGFLSHGRMGSYNEATAIAVQTGSPADIAAVRKTHTEPGSVSISNSRLSMISGYSRGQDTLRADLKSSISPTSTRPSRSAYPFPASVGNGRPMPLRTSVTEDRAAKSSPTDARRQTALGSG
jgi:hypothetical protein